MDVLTDFRDDVVARLCVDHRTKVPYGDHVTVYRLAIDTGFARYFRKVMAPPEGVPCRRRKEPSLALGRLVPSRALGGPMTLANFRLGARSCEKTRRHLGAGR